MMPTTQNAASSTILGPTPAGSSVLGTTPIGSASLGPTPAGSSVLGTTPIGSASLTPPATPASTNTNTNNTNTNTTTSGTLSPAAIQAVQDSINGAIGQNQNAFNVTTAINAHNDQQAQLDQAKNLQDNTTAHTVAYQNAEQAAAQGNQGLKAVLASLGALNGTGSLLAGRAVANSANGDIGTANNTYQTNNEAIQKAISDYQQQVSDRDTTLANSLATDNRNAQVTGLQDEINQAENIGDTSLVAQLLPQIAGATAPAQSLDPASVLYNGANVGAYAPTSSLNVTTAPSQPGATAGPTPVNSPLNIIKTGSTPA